MAPRTKNQAPGAKRKGGKKNDAAADVAPPPEGYRLSAEREEELTTEALALGDQLVAFPGNHARRVAWSSRIQLAAQRDATDLVRTPFPKGEPPLTQAEIDGMRDRIELWRVTQSRWRSVQATQQKATANFEKAAAEASTHRLLLLRFFDLQFRNNPAGQRRLSEIRAGSGAADLVQDVSDVLVLCDEHKDDLVAGPRDEAGSAARLAELSPMLSRLLADKALSPEALQARKLRDAAYTLVSNAERRIRAAATYWYDGTDKMKDYAFFTPSSPGTRAEAEEDAPIDAPSPTPAAPAEADAAPPA